MNRKHTAQAFQVADASAYGMMLLVVLCIAALLFALPKMVIGTYQLSVPQFLSILVLAISVMAASFLSTRRVVASNLFIAVLFLALGVVNWSRPYVLLVAIPVIAVFMAPVTLAYIEVKQKLRGR